jgi:tripartite ATP-independent transporter DctP family solute receptor
MTFRVSTGRRLRAAALAAVLATGSLLIAACGDDEDADETPAAAAAEATQEAGSESAPSGDVVKLQWGTITAPEHPMTKMAEWFAARVKENSGGRVEIEVVPSGALGDDAELQEAVSIGAVEMGTGGNTLQMFPQSGVFWMPFIFRDAEHARAVLGGEIGKEVFDTFLDKGVRVLYVEDHGFRQVSSNKPIRSLADFEGLKIRVPEAPLFIETFKALGANPTPLDFAELYSGLEQGIVDAQENAFVATLAPKFYEVQKYLAVTNHMHTPNPVMINDKFFQGLDSELQEAFTKTAEEAREYQYSIADEEDAAARDALVAEGMELSELSYDELRAAVQPVYESIGAEYDPDLLARIEAVGK